MLAGYQSTAGRYRPVRVADGPITARCRLIKNASWEDSVLKTVVRNLLLFFVQSNLNGPTFWNHGNSSRHGHKQHTFA